ncbi:MAG: class I SAM-dependent methyltransferase [Planctomycetota bacterium]
MAYQLDISDYRYVDAHVRPHHRLLVPAVFEIIDRLARTGADRRVFELGCGNGAVAALLTQRNFEVIGVDLSKVGIEQANLAYPHIQLFQGSAYDDLAGKFGQFPLVLSLEVVEHVYFPRRYAACVHSLLTEGGVAIISTPYHGYLKNLALAITGKMDTHYSAMRDHGHIKFWSVRTLTQLLKESGFKSLEFVRVGRIPILAKSMIAVAQK